MKGATSETRQRSQVSIEGPPPLSDHEFALFQRFIHDATGIELTQAKRALLIARLAGRLRELELPTFGAYFLRVTKGGDLEERQRMFDCISTNETHFFREPRHFEFLERVAIPAWAEAAREGRRARTIRVWSAACSTGEEPYSVAMLLLHHLPPSEGWLIDVLATDLSTRALERARRGLFRIERAAEIPNAYLKAFMWKGVGRDAERMKVDEALQSVVRFQWLNLKAERYDVAGLFDVVLCRNVLIYFNAETRRGVVERVVQHLAPAGYFFIGHAESLYGVTTRVKSVIPSVYAFAAPGKR